MARPRVFLRPLLRVSFLLSFPFAGLAWAQTLPANSTQAPTAGATRDQAQVSPADPAPPATVFHHAEASRYWLSGQANLVFQWHPRFRAAYSGRNSLRPDPESGLYRVLTLYTGLQLSRTTEILFDLESSSGVTLSDGLGLGGFSNLDVVRTPFLGAKPYTARLILRQIIPLSRERVPVTRGPLGLAASLPARRLEFRVGKFGLTDFFDVNSVGSDSHLQFLNWTVDVTGAWDFAADTRGYTYGVMVEYQDRRWGVRFAEALMPKEANGIDLEWNLRRAHAENVEIELRRQFLPKRNGVVRLLGYVNHANMGSYRQAVERFQAGRDPQPDVTAHPRQARSKYGVGMNFEQELTGWLTVFGRWGWNDGRNETFAFTEVDRSISGGAGASGARWRRRLDRAGLALASNGLSGDHRRYLALGGHGFLLGDGRLTYGREWIVEGYYTAHFWRGVFGSFVLQHIWNPGYNRDRGPVLVPALRLHVEF